MGYEDNNLRQSLLVRAVEAEYLELRMDFYSITFVSHIKHIQSKFHISSNDTTSNLRTCLYLFTLQIAIVVLLGSELFKDFYFPFISFRVLMVRFICAVLLHFQLEGEIK
jgi:hypothetical protein